MPAFEVTREITRTYRWVIHAPDLRAAQDAVVHMSEGDADDVQVRVSPLRVRELPEIDERVR